MSEKRNVPKLRFPFFNSNWIISEFGKITDIIDCKHRTPPYVEEGIPVISPGTIKWGPLDTISPTKRVSEIEYQSLMDHCSPDVGDFILSRNQSVGVASIIFRLKKFVLGQDTVLIHPYATEPFFTYYCLQTEKTQTKIVKLSGGSTFSRINLGEIRKLKIDVSESIEEQQKIAGFLTAVDRRIELLQQKKEKLERYKKGVMRQLFTRKIRFKADDGSEFPDWEEKKLGDVFEIVGGGTPDTTNSEYWDGTINWFTPTEVKKKYLSESRRKITAEGVKTSSAKLLPKGTLLFTSRATIGDVGITTDFSTTNQGFQSFLPNSVVNTEFFYYWIKQNVNLFLKKSSGSTFPEISKTETQKIVMTVPVFEEQEKISQFLSSLDENLENLSQQIQQSQIWKKGLLQQMFA